MDWGHHPDGLTHNDGKPVLVMSNAESWNSPAFFDQASETWEKAANDALADAGSAARIDSRSLCSTGGWPACHRMRCAWRGA